jgi:ATP-binding cassette subfamily B protein
MPPRDATADQPAAARLADGIRLEGVSFAYPGTERLVLDSIDLALPAGSVVALVGENGAGKTTLVKLLCKLYEPTAGRILVDGAPLSRVRADDWRRRLSGAFQDFFRFELRALHSVGVGDVPRIDDEPAVVAAVEKAGAGEVVEGLPAGLASQLGATWPGGVEVSFGQSQKLALARGFMRDGPLLLVLDDRRPRSTPRPSTSSSSGSPRRRAGKATPAASRSWCRTVSRPCAWPTSSSSSTAPAWPRSARTRS